MAAFNSNPPACHWFLITPLEAAANYPQAGGCVPGVTSPPLQPLSPLFGGFREGGTAGVGCRRAAGTPFLGDAVLGVSRKWGSPSLTHLAPMLHGGPPKRT